MFDIIPSPRRRPGFSLVLLVCTRFVYATNHPIFWTVYDLQCGNHIARPCKAALQPAIYWHSTIFMWRPIANLGLAQVSRSYLQCLETSLV